MTTWVRRNPFNVQRGTRRITGFMMHNAKLEGGKTADC